MLYLYRRIFLGKMTKEDLMAILDLNWREKMVFAPLVALVLWMGIYPSSFIDVMAPSVGRLVEGYEASLASAEAPLFASLWSQR
jgi:NADH-quinone oxidoreductase subunit M